MAGRSLEDFIRDMPKVELHMHIEGSLEPELMWELAQRNGVSLPFISIGEIYAAYQFNNLQEFLDIYYQGMSVLQTEQDFFDLTMAYMGKCAEQNVMHTEIFFDPQGHTARGVDFDVVLGGIREALAEAEEQYGISSEIIMCFLRHLPEAEAEETLDQLLNSKFRDDVIGVGLDSGEQGNPPTKFQNVFDRAYKEGLHLVAHAGEEGPAEYVWQAYNDLGVERIDHGNRCLEDDEITEALAREGIGLTVCPLSNLALKGVTDLKDHPLRRMMRAGLVVSVNSDDPAYFGGYMNENFIRIARVLNLGKQEVMQLAYNAINTSFAPATRKEELRRALAMHPVEFKYSHISPRLG